MQHISGGYEPSGKMAEMTEGQDFFFLFHLVYIKLKKGQRDTQRERGCGEREEDMKRKKKVCIINKHQITLV